MLYGAASFQARIHTKSAHLKDDFYGIDVQEHGRPEDAFEHVELVVDLPRIDLVEELRHSQLQQSKLKDTEDLVHHGLNQEQVYLPGHNHVGSNILV